MCKLFQRTVSGEPRCIVVYISGASMHRTRANTALRGPESNARYALANCKSVQSLARVLHLAALCTMKYGKYDLHKSSANISVGTSYSWYYRKNDNPTSRKAKRLARAASDSTLFSDYANQISMFEKEKSAKKCKKSVSDVSKNTRVKYNPRTFKPVYMEPFIGNFYYGKPLPGYEDTQKTEEKISYLPDSDIVTASEDNTAESLTTAPTVVDLPELVRNPLYGCIGADVQRSTSEYLTDSGNSKDSQLKSSSCTELRNTMCSSKASEEVLSNILKDYKKIMKEWNNTITNHYSTISHCSKQGSSLCRKSNTDSYVRSLHSTLSCRRPSRCAKAATNRHYSYAYTTKHCKKSKSSDQRKTQSLGRNQTFSNWSSTLQKLKKKSKFWKIDQTLTASECECLEAIYADYDKRLQEWCDTISHCSSYITSVIVASLLCLRFSVSFTLHTKINCNIFFISRVTKRKLRNQKTSTCFQLHWSAKRTYCLATFTSCSHFTRTCSSKTSKSRFQRRNSWHCVSLKR